MDSLNQSLFKMAKYCTEHPEQEMDFIVEKSMDGQAEQKIALYKCPLCNPLFEFVGITFVLGFKERES